MRGRWVRTGATAAVAVAVAGGGYAAYAAAMEGPSGYRTALATTGDVEQTIALSGTVSPVGRTDLAFGADGTVAAVVAQGAHVQKGQVVARLDRTALRRDLTQARAALDSAKLQLEKDEADQTDQATSAASSSSATTTTPSSQAHQPAQQPAPQVTPTTQPTQASNNQQHDTGQPSGSSDATQALVSRIRALQDKVTTAQTGLDDAKAGLDAATTSLGDTSTRLENVLDAIDKVAGDLGDGGDLSKALNQAKQDCATSGDGTATADATACADDLTNALSALGVAQTDVPSTAADSDLVTAQNDVAAAQTGVASAQDAVASAKGDLADYVAQLDMLLSSAPSAPGGTSTQSTGPSETTTQPSQPSSQPTAQPSTQGSRQPSSKQPSSKQPSSQQSSTPSGQTPTQQDAVGGTVTAATLAQDQARIDQAKADLVGARQSLSGATLRAPAAGIAAAVDVAKGDTASAGTDVVTIVSKGLTSVEVSVSDSQVRQIKVGQRATVTPAGSSSRFAGRVSRVGELPDTSSGSTTYSVTVILDKRGLGLLTGTTAAVDVVVGHADGVLTVPSSAVSDDTVTVLSHGQPQQVPVTTGLVGRSRTQITDGLTAGQQVVLADLSIPLPTGDSETGPSFGGFDKAPQLGGSGGPMQGPVTFVR